MKLFLSMAMIVSVAALVLVSGIVFQTHVSLMFLVMALMMDISTTRKCLKLGGVETNPIVNFFFKKIGISTTMVIWCAIWGIVIWYRVIPAPPEVQTAIAMAYWVVPISNARVLKKLRARQRKAEETE